MISAMLDHNRFKLLHGPYHMPRCKVGGWLRCCIRGLVRVEGIMDAPMQWPYTKQAGRAGRPILILCGDLVRAVQRESETAIMYFWGVSTTTVTKWRKALGVERANEGTRSLFSRWGHETLSREDIARKRLEAVKSPERAAKSGAARRGKVLSEETRAAISRAKLGQKHSDASKRKMSAAQRRRVRPPRGASFEPEVTALLGTMTDREVAERTGLTEPAVASRRRVLKIAAFLKKRPQQRPLKWSAARVKLLGTMPDGALAKKLGCTLMAVFYARRRLGIAAYRQS
jgi:hypothetical protein